MSDDDLVISKGAWPAVEFERMVVSMGRAIVARQRQRDETGAPPLLPFEGYLSLESVQHLVNEDTRGSGYLRPGAPELFAALVKRRVLRPATEQEFRDLELAQHQRDFRAKSYARENWFVLLADGFEKVYPGEKPDARTKSSGR